MKDYVNKDNGENMIKLAFVISYLTKNGPSNVLIDMIENLDSFKYDITLITLFSGNDQNIVEKLKEKKIHVYECKTLSRLKCILGDNLEFIDIIKKENFDIIHSHGLIPDILNVDNKNYSKKITTIHNNMFEDYYFRYGYVRGKVLTKLHIYTLKKMDVCVACSRHICLLMQNYLSNMTYVRNGIKNAVERKNVTRAELGIPESAKIFVYAGTFTKRKNIVFLIDNFIKNYSEDEYLLMLGDGPEIHCLSLNSCDHVLFLGFQEDIISYFGISDIYVSASKSEGFSISVLEALSCGLKLFLSNISSHEEIFDMNSSLYMGEMFCVDDDGKDFAQKIKKIRNDYAKTERGDIKQFQQTKLSDREMTMAYEKIYLEQLN